MITKPKLFYFSLASLIISLATSWTFTRVIETATTRDFNFATPLAFACVFCQSCIALVGIAASLKRP